MSATETPPHPREAQSAPAAASTSAGDGGRINSSLQRLLILLAAIMSILALRISSNAYWDRWASSWSTQYTDDAYVQSDVSMLSARISGNVRHVLIHDYPNVRAGQTLFEIDPADDQAAVDGAQVVHARGVKMLAEAVSREANILAYVDTFQISYWGALLGLCTMALLNQPPPGPLSPRY